MPPRTTKTRLNTTTEKAQNMTTLNRSTYMIPTANIAQLARLLSAAKNSGFNAVVTRRKTVTILEVK